MGGGRESVRIRRLQGSARMSSRRLSAAALRATLLRRFALQLRNRKPNSMERNCLSPVVTPGCRFGVPVRCLGSPAGEMAAHRHRLLSTIRKSFANYMRFSLPPPKKIRRKESGELKRKKNKPHSKITSLTPSHASLSTSSGSDFISALSRFGLGYSVIFGTILAAKRTNFRAIARKFSRKAATSSLALLLPFSRRLSSLREDKHACCFCRKNFIFLFSTPAALTGGYGKI